METHPTEQEKVETIAVAPEVESKSFFERVPVQIALVLAVLITTVLVVVFYNDISSVSESWFAKYGVRECWLVDLKRREFVLLGFANGLVAERTLLIGHQRIASAVLPGLQLTPADLLGSW